MSKRRGCNAEFANVVIKSGDNKNLLDIFEDSVYQALTDTSYERKYGDSTYFFIDVGAFVEDEEICIYGRMVKDTILHAEQQYEAGELVESEEQIKSAPSSIFVLLLSNHRLIYVRENSRSPWLDSFKSTLKLFVRDAHKKFIDEEYQAHQMIGGPRVTKKRLVEENPYPTVHLTALATKGSVEQFIMKMGKLETVTTELLPTNSEFDNDSFFEDLRESADRIKSSSAKLTYSSKEGLDKAEAIRQIAAVSSQGNHNVRLRGSDNEGAKLDAKNEDFAVKISVTIGGGSLKKTTENLKEIFIKQVKAGGVVLPKITDATKNKLNRLKAFLQ